MIQLASNVIIHLIERFGYVAIAGMMFLESALIPIPSEVVMPFSGFVSAIGKLDFWLVVAFGVVGQMLGSTFIYFVGKRQGRHLLEKYGKYLLIRTKDIQQADKWFERFGEATVFFGRVLPVTRTFISLPAGVSEMRFGKFAAYSFLGIVPWTLGLAWLGVKMGENWSQLKQYFHVLDFFVGGAVLILVVLYVRNHLNKRGEAD